MSAKAETEPGMPLSEQEYTSFFSALKPDWRAKLACKIRNVSGCNHHKVHRLDLYENHGVIPKGRICSEMESPPWFDSFCKFAEYRCSSGQYYIKRVACPADQHRGLEDLVQKVALEALAPDNIQMLPFERERPLAPSPSAQDLADVIAHAANEDSATRNIELAAHLVADHSSKEGYPWRRHWESDDVRKHHQHRSLARLTDPLGTTHISTAVGKTTVHGVLMLTQVSVAVGPLLTSKTDNGVTSTPDLRVSQGEMAESRLMTSSPGPQDAPRGSALPRGLFAEEDPRTPPEPEATSEIWPETSQEETGLPVPLVKDMLAGIWARMTPAPDAEHGLPRSRVPLVPGRVVTHETPARAAPKTTTMPLRAVDAKHVMRRTIKMQPTPKQARKTSGLAVAHTAQEPPPANTGRHKAAWLSVVQSGVPPKRAPHLVPKDPLQVPPQGATRKDGSWQETAELPLGRKHQEGLAAPGLRGRRVLAHRTPGERVQTEGIFGNGVKYTVNVKGAVSRTKGHRHYNGGVEIVVTAQQDAIREGSLRGLLKTSRAMANTVAPVTAGKLIEEEEMEATQAIPQSGATLNIKVIQDIVLHQFKTSHRKGLEWAEEVAKEMDSVQSRLGDPHMAEVMVHEAASEVMQQVAENKKGALLGDSPEMEEPLSEISELNRETEDAEPETNKKVGRVRSLKDENEASETGDTENEEMVEARQDTEKILNERPNVRKKAVRKAADIQEEANKQAAEKLHAKKERERELAQNGIHELAREAADTEKKGSEKLEFQEIKVITKTKKMINIARAKKRVKAAEKETHAAKTLTTIVLSEEKMDASGQKIKGTKQKVCTLLAKAAAKKRQQDTQGVEEVAMADMKDSEAAEQEAMKLTAVKAIQDMELWLKTMKAEEAGKKEEQDIEEEAGNETGETTKTEAGEEDVGHSMHKKTEVEGTGKGKRRLESKAAKDGQNQVASRDKLDKAKGLVQKAKYKTPQEKELMKELGQKVNPEKYPSVAPRLGPTTDFVKRRRQHWKGKMKEGAEQESSLDTKKNKETAVTPAKVPMDTDNAVSIETEQKEAHDHSKTIKKTVAGQESASKPLAIVQEPEKEAKPGKTKAKPKSEPDTSIKVRAVVSNVINSKALKEKIRKEIYELLKSSISLTVPKRIAATTVVVSVTVRMKTPAKGVWITKPASNLKMLTKSKKTRMIDMVPPSGKVDKPTEPTIRHMVPIGGDPESLFSIEKDDTSAMMCTKVLQGSCTTDFAVQAWKTFEEKALGYGDMVCDSEGRQHQEICPMCAFCSLKMEQCKTKNNLKRVRCDTQVSFTKFINPTIESQNMKSKNKVKN
ncbi:uncharacterized protein LOC144768939 [Lissotriton helveticus]